MALEKSHLHQNFLFVFKFIIAYMTWLLSACLSIFFEEGIMTMFLFCSYLKFVFIGLSFSLAIWWNLNMTIEFCLDSSLREKCINTEFFLVRIFPSLDLIRSLLPLE